MSITTFITRLEPGPDDGPVLAVKDIIDVAGVPTTAGSRAVADGVSPAPIDAACMRGARSHRARLIGKTNLFELAFGASGLNEHFGTPVNPLDPRVVPGGSSSGSAVVVATHEADVAYGSDTGGSIRIPSAFCGTAGLKTTFGRIPLGGVWPLAPSLDTIGPMARDVAGLVLGMELLEPGFAVDVPAAGSVARLRLPGIEVDPLIDSAVDSALALAELDVSEWELSQWLDAHRAALAIINFEAVRSNRRLTDNPALRAKLGHFVAARLESAAATTQAQAEAARQFQPNLRDELGALLDRFQLLALPSVRFFPPPLEGAATITYTELTSPLNLAGLPALSLPVPTSGPLPAGLQLVARAGDEALLLATGGCVEQALA
ncbi:MAG TPA: amidase [Acidimicrobiales bacterium]|nr:amidase [Acidimicrobiales bacterium]